MLEQIVGQLEQLCLKLGIKNGYTPTVLNFKQQFIPQKWPRMGKGAITKVLELVFGILKRPWSQERRWWPEMECGCRYSSQWRWDKLDEMWSNFGILKINRAVSLTTFWRRSVWYLGMPKRRQLQYSKCEVTNTRSRVFMDSRLRNFLIWRFRRNCKKMKLPGWMYAEWMSMVPSVC